MVATPQSNLDSAISIQNGFLLRRRQDNVFKCDYVSTIIPQTNSSIGRILMSPLKPLSRLLSIPRSQILQTSVWMISRPHDIVSSPRCVIIITKLFYFQGSQLIFIISEILRKIKFSLGSEGKNRTYTKWVKVICTNHYTTPLYLLIGLAFNVYHLSVRTSCHHIRFVMLLFIE